MGRMSARFIAQQVCMSVKDVYEMWKDMGFVEKDKFGDWVLTNLGRENGGKMSSGSRLSVPTFDLDDITEKMIDFYNKTHQK